MRLSLVNKFAISCILLLRPFLGPAQCKFTVTCTQFAIMQLQEKSLLHAIQAIILRLLSCNQFDLFFTHCTLYINHMVVIAKNFFK